MSGKPRRIWTALFLLIIVLLAVVVLWQRRTPGVAEPLRGSAGVADAPAGSTDSRLPGNEVTLAAAPTSPPAAQDPSPSPTVAAQAPERILPVEESALGQLWIIGTVRGGKGEPVAAAEVTLARQVMQSSRLTKGAGDAMFSRAVTLDGTTTDSAGYYEIPLISEPPIVVSVMAKDFACAGAILYPVDLRPVTTADGLRVVRHDFQVTRGIIFSGRVVDESGTPVEGAEVAFRSPPSSGRAWVLAGLHEQVILSDDGGRFSFPHVLTGEEAMLRLNKVGHAAVEYEVPAGSTDRDWILPGGGGRIGGRVLDADGRPLQRLPVFACAGKPGNFANIDPVRLSTETDADGEFAFHPLKAGSWAVTAEQRDAGIFGIRGAAGAVVVLGEFETKEGIELRLAAPLTIRGIVMTDGAETPVEGASISTWMTDLPRADSVASDGEGRFELANLQMTFESWEKLREYFFATKDGYLEGSFSGSPTNNGNGVVEEKIILKRADTVSLSGVVVDRKGQRMRDVLVVGDGLPEAKALTDATGRFTLPVLQDSLLNLSATPPRGPKSFHPPIQVQRDPIKNLEIVLDPGAALELIALDPDGKPLPGAVVWAMRRTYATNWSSASHFRREPADEAGRLLIEDLPSSGAVLDPKFDRVSMDAGAEHEDYDTVEVTDIRLEPGVTNRQEFRLLAKDISGVLEGFVRTESGTPIEGATVQVQGKAMKITTTDALGYFHIEEIRPDNYYTRIDHPDYKTWGERLDVPAHDVSVTLEPRAK